MRVVRETDDYIVLDEFLEPRDFELMPQYTQLRDSARNPKTTHTQFIFPVPNRILIMRRGLWHKIGLVKSNAPFARCSVAGFFLPDA